MTTIKGYKKEKFDKLLKLKKKG